MLFNFPLMNFFRRDELTPRVSDTLARYDETVLRFVGENYPHPLRTGDWELSRALDASRSVPIGSSVLDTGSFNTYLPLALAAAGYRMTASDLLVRQFVRGFGRAVGLAVSQPNEVPFFKWMGVYRKAAVQVRNLDVSKIRCANASFDCVIALSVLEYVHNVRGGLSEMYRVLAPGGRLLISTACSPEPELYWEGVRSFSESELESLFKGYPVTSVRNRPDFAPQNWCYRLDRPVVTAFVEVTKPR
jgi:SAM-dependent methyltransferase